MAVELDCFLALGHSGGAVPVSHRSSLFVGSFKLNAADHQRTLGRKSITTQAVCKTPGPRFSPSAKNADRARRCARADE